VLVLYGAAVCAGMVALALARGGIDVGLLLALPALAVVLGAGFVLARVEL
jgi:hypothetical protein